MGERRYLPDGYWSQLLAHERSIHTQASPTGMKGLRKAVWQGQKGGVPSGWVGYRARLPFMAACSFGELTVGRFIPRNSPLLKDRRPQGRPLEAAHFGYTALRVPFMGGIAELALKNWAVLDIHVGGAADVLKYRFGRPELELRRSDREWMLREMQKGASGEYSLDMAGSPMDIPTSHMGNKNWLDRFGLQISWPAGGPPGIAGQTPQDRGK